MPAPNAYFYEVQSRTKELKLITGRFFPAGTGAPTGAVGQGYTVARTSAGVFTVTFEHTWQTLISFWATLQLSAADDKVLQVGDIDLSARTAIIRVYDVSAGAAADISADADNSISFGFAFKRTTVAR